MILKLVTALSVIFGAGLAQAETCTLIQKVVKDGVESVVETAKFEVLPSGNATVYGAKTSKFDFILAYEDGLLIPSVTMEGGVRFEFTVSTSSTKADGIRVQNGADIAEVSCVE